MDLLGKITQLFSGGNLVKDIVDGADRFITTKEDKLQLEMMAKEIAHKQELALQRATLEAEAEFNQRIKDLEGTGKDLLQAGWLGRIVLFLRGAQRPMWGYGVFVLDILVFSGKYDVMGNSQMESILWIINLLVLGFLFGERAVQNVAPMIKDLVKTKRS